MMQPRTWKGTLVPLTLALMIVPLSFASEAPERDAPVAAQTTQAADLSTLPRFDLVDRSAPTTEQALEIVALLTDWQLDTRGEDGEAPGTTPYTSAHAALVALADAHDTTWDAALIAADLHLKAPLLDAAIARFVTDFIHFERTTAETFGHLADEVSRAELERQGQNLRLDAVVRAQEALFASALALEHALQQTPVRPLAVFAAPGAYHIDLTGTCGHDVYTEDLPLIMDDCGDDIYLNNAGGGGFSTLGTPSFPAAALVDLDGNDRYASSRPAAVNGGGFGGAGFLYDADGDDAYETPESNDGVNGGGSVGSGFLVDAAGNDLYAAGGWGTNGGGYVGGRGLLVDMAGDDTYSGTHEAVNGGGGIGNGALWDDGGDDHYTADAIGVNGGAFGGSALLYDRIGTDRYTDDVVGDVFDLTVVPKELNGAQVDDA